MHQYEFSRGAKFELKLVSHGTLVWHSTCMNF
uniref:Uncharacterized protein n=1 Tax=Anguilla anguilla TaxID=7936 RepID=A0A0E9SCI3_ANGAN